MDEATGDVWRSDASSLHGFGADRGRDIVLIVGDDRLHVHSMIVRLFLAGKVFDSIVEQAYSETHHEVRLVDDSAEAWKLLLAGCYESVDKLMDKQWKAMDALAVLPLLHKYEGDKMMPGIVEVLKRSESRPFRTPEAVEELDRLDVSEVLAAWFGDMTWLTYETMSLFLKRGPESSLCHRTLIALRNRLGSDMDMPSGGPADARKEIINQVSALLPNLSERSSEVAIDMLLSRCSQSAWTPQLAELLTECGFPSVPVAWFTGSQLDVNWFTTERLKQFLDGCCDDRILGALLTGIQSFPVDVTKVALLLEYTPKLQKFKDKLRVMLNSVPELARSASLMDAMANAGFLQTASDWVDSQSGDSIQAIISEIKHVDLLRKAALHLSYSYDVQKELLERARAENFRLSRELTASQGQCTQLVLRLDNLMDLEKGKGKSKGKGKGKGGKESWFS